VDDDPEAFSALRLLVGAGGTDIARINGLAVTDELEGGDRNPRESGRACLGQVARFSLFEVPED
jgi:hypothetical protein